MYISFLTVIKSRRRCKHMGYSESSKRATYKYHAAKIKRVPLDMQISEYDDLKRAAANNGESVNGFIKTAIRERLARLK